MPWHGVAALWLASSGLAWKLWSLCSAAETLVVFFCPVAHQVNPSVNEYIGCLLIGRKADEGLAVSSSHSFKDIKKLRRHALVLARVQSLWSELSPYLPNIHFIQSKSQLSAHTWKCNHIESSRHSRVVAIMQHRHCPVVEKWKMKPVVDQKLKIYLCHEWEG